MIDLTDKQKDEVIEQYVELVVDNMDTKTMMQSITERLTEVYQDYSREELQTQVEETHGKELYKELVDNVCNPTVEKPEEDESYDPEYDAASYT